MARTKCHIAMYRVPKSENLKNFCPLIKLGPTLNKFLKILTSIIEKRNTLDTCIKFERNVFHLS
jgi:hypothetical protein